MMRNYTKMIYSDDKRYIKMTTIDDEDFVEKIEMCLCKENVYHLDYSNYVFNLCKHCKAPSTDKIQFEKGKYYKYFIEDEDSYWVYHNEDDDDGEGRRFHSDNFKEKDHNMRSFSKYFMYGRLLKLKVLENEYFTG